MPFVRRRRTVPADLGGKLGGEPVHPISDRLVRNCYVSAVSTPLIFWLSSAVLPSGR
jgi:hypothetical protein